MGLGRIGVNSIAIDKSVKKYLPYNNTLYPN